MFQVLALLCDWFNGSDNIDKSFIFKSLGNTETGCKMGKDLSGEYKEPKVTKLSTFLFSFKYYTFCNDSFYCI